MKIYVVFIIRHYGNKPSADRTVGWFDSFEKAEKAILENHLDLFERLYEYACIEEIEQGVYPCPSVIQWYHATPTGKFGMDEYIDISKCDPPEWSKGFAGWSMG